MKRSGKVVLVLSGALAAGGLAGCDSSYDFPPPQVSADNTYTNNYYVRGVGYYHAPYRGWYPYPYNYYLPGQGYYHGGNWTSEPHPSTVAASQPTTESVHSANNKGSAAARSGSISRRGFGSSSHSTSS